MTMSSTSLLLLTAASIALMHTLVGPDHYLPFAGMARAFSWSPRRTVVVTLLCGLGHVLSSALLGMVGIALGLGLASLQAIESAHGQFAAWALTAFGLLYGAWGLRRGLRNQPHGHTHVHADGTIHAHTHIHEHDHLHAHAKEATKVTPWLLFSVFLLGPCEPLIPLVMYPAAKRDWLDVGLVTLVFGLVTLLTMTAAVLSCAAGMRQVRLAHLERYSHALAGSVIALCGFAILVLHV